MTGFTLKQAISIVSTLTQDRICTETRNQYCEYTDMAWVAQEEVTRAVVALQRVAGLSLSTRLALLTTCLLHILG